MKTDFYTKIMLTLIALFLAVLSFDKVYGVAVPNAEAQTKRIKWECSQTAYWSLRGTMDETANLRAHPDTRINELGWTVVVPFGKTQSGPDGEWYFCGHR